MVHTFKCVNKIVTTNKYIKIHVLYNIENSLQYVSLNDFYICLMVFDV